MWKLTSSFVFLLKFILKYTAEVCDICKDIQSSNTVHFSLPKISQVEEPWTFLLISKILSHPSTLLTIWVRPKCWIYFVIFLTADASNKVCKYVSFEIPKMGWSSTKLRYPLSVNWLHDTRLWERNQHFHHIHCFKVRERVSPCTQTKMSLYFGLIMSLLLIYAKSSHVQ